jgi:hypothetical protein
MPLLFFKNSILNKRPSVSKFRFYRGPFFISKVAENADVNGVPTDIQKIQEVLQKKINGEVLGSDDLLTLSTATSDQLFQATVSFVSKLPSSLNQLKVGDIVKLKFKLKFISVQKETNKSFVNGNRSNIFDQPVNPLKLAPYLEKFITLHYGVTKSDSNIELGSLAMLLEIAIWRSYIRHMTTDMVLLEATQVKIVYPKQRVSKQLSIGGLQSGGLDSNAHSISPKIYSIKLASPFVVGALDHYVLKLPLISNTMIDAAAIKCSIADKPLIETFMDFLAKPLIMCLEADSARKITLQLVIENDRDDVIAKFVAVNSCFNLGFNLSRQTLSFPQNIGLKALPIKKVISANSGNVGNSAEISVDVWDAGVEVVNDKPKNQLLFTTENFEKQASLAQKFINRGWTPENLEAYLNKSTSLPANSTVINQIPKTLNGRRVDAMDPRFLSALKQQIFLMVPDEENA